MGRKRRKIDQRNQKKTKMQHTQSIGRILIAIMIVKIIIMNDGYNDNHMVTMIVITIVIMIHLYAIHY